MRTTLCYLMDVRRIIRTASTSLAMCHLPNHVPDVKGLFKKMRKLNLSSFQRVTCYSASLNLNIFWCKSSHLSNFSIISQLSVIRKRRAASCIDSHSLMALFRFKKAPVQIASYSFSTILEPLETWWRSGRLHLAFPISPFCWKFNQRPLRPPWTYYSTTGAAPLFFQFFRVRR